MKQLGPREEELKKVLRYGTQGEWSPMYYRPDLLIHTSRVFWITQEIVQFLSNINSTLFSPEKTCELAKFHDDTEILAGDVIALKKEKFTEEEKKEYEKITLSAIEVLSQNYSSLTQEDYKKLLLLDAQKDSVEYFIVAYADKLDAHMEICHEIFAGSTLCTTKLTRFGEDIYPFEYTKNKIILLEKKLSEIFGVSLAGKHPLFILDETIEYKTAMKERPFHSAENIRNTTGYSLYDFWKELHFLSGNSRQKEYLWTRREFT